MKKITFNCETITPLFLGEAKKEMVELRPPAIKAAMRFWWRAAHAHLTLPVMKSQEAEIFGGGGTDAKSAKFDIVLSEPSLNPVRYKYPPNDNSDAIAGINMGTATGSQYLMYTFFYLKKKGQYLPPNTTFNVSFYFDNDNLEIKQILGSFWLLVFFGNIGERARRGLGSFKVTGTSDNDRLLGDFNFTAYNFEAIRSGLTLIKGSTVFNSATTTLVNNTNSHIFNNEIYVSNNNHQTWKDALNDIGSKMKNFRLDAQNHAILAKNASAIFGLPIKHRVGSPIKPKDFERRASPLIIKIIQVGTNEFRWVLIRLEGDFLPTGNDELNVQTMLTHQVGRFSVTTHKYLKADDSVLTSFLNITILNMTKI